MPNNNQIIQWYPGHMSKAIRNIEQDLRLIDIVIEVLDARIPQSSRNESLEKLCGKKPLVLVLNKSDLADDALTKRWLQYYRHKGYQAISLYAVQKRGIKDLVTAVSKAAEPLQKRLEAKGRERRPVRAMVVGIPNTGKSTVINALTDNAVAKTGNKPGVTRGRQWLKTSLGIELMDTPGISWPKFTSAEAAYKLAATGAVADAAFPVYPVADYMVQWIAAHHPQGITERYQMETLSGDTQQILGAIGHKRGILASGGIVRLEDVALIFLQEYRKGKLGRFTLESPE